MYPYRLLSNIFILSSVYRSWFNRILSWRIPSKYPILWNTPVNGWHRNISFRFSVNDVALYTHASLQGVTSVINLGCLDFINVRHHMLFTLLSLSQLSQRLNLTHCIGSYLVYHIFNLTKTSSSLMWFLFISCLAFFLWLLLLFHYIYSIMILIFFIFIGLIPLMKPNSFNLIIRIPICDTIVAPITSRSHIQKSH